MVATQNMLMLVPNITMKEPYMSYINSSFHSCGVEINVSN